VKNAVKHEENISVSEGVKNKENFEIGSRRSTHSTAGNFQSNRYMDELFLMKI